MRNVLRTLVAALFLGCTVAPSGWEYDLDDLRKHGVTIIKDPEEAISLVNRQDVCTVVLFGAPWDGHFINFLRNVGYWQQLARDLQPKKESDEETLDEGPPFPMELAFYCYSSGDYYDDCNDIPPELHHTYTAGSYMWIVYRDGEKLWANSMERHGVGYSPRPCRFPHPQNEGMIDAACLKAICNSGESDSSGGDKKSEF